MSTVLYLPEVAFSRWLTDRTAEISTAGCESGDAYVLNIETREWTQLGPIGRRYWGPDNKAFAEYAWPYIGLGGSFWIYDIERNIRVRQYKWQVQESTPCWTSTGSHLIYTSQAITTINSSQVIISPSQIWIMDKQSGEERMLLGDAEYNYFLPSRKSTEWICGWRGDWIRAQKTSYVITAVPIEPFGDTWEAIKCPIYGRGCEGVQWLGLNWRTSISLPWEQIPTDGNVN